MSNILSRKIKREKLASLKDEVKDFHPLLDIIFPKLPRVNHFEYTHGNNEKGADFILQRIDDTTNEPEYIGVIVKKGPIKSSLTNIFDQIDDCDSDRLMFNGKIKIRLDEIWIISNEHITLRAKEKINERFSTRKIKFLDRDITIKWIDSYSPHFWTSLALDIGQYLDSVFQSMSEMDAAYSLLPADVEPFYIQINLRKVEHSYTLNKIKKPTTIDILELLKKQDIILIEGGPGSGKSQMIRNTVKYYSNTQTFLSEKNLPVYVTFQEFKKDYSEDVTILLKDKLKTTTNIIKNNTITKIIFLDGFDESIDELRDTESEIKLLFDSVKKLGNTKLVITTRPLDIIDYDSTLPQKTHVYELVPFGLTQILALFEKICSQIQIADRLYEDLKKSDLFKQLPSNPISAILLAKLMSENSNDLPANLTEVYKKYTELMLGRWDIDKGLKSDQEYEVGKNILMYIAGYFIENDLSCISCDEALSHFTEYLSERNLQISPENIFNKIVCRSGILQKNSTNNTIYFKHRSFAEFFYAQFKAKHYDKKFLDKRVFSPIWRNIYFFYVGVNKDCEEILETMLQTEITEPIERFMRVTNMADYFLAAYTTPYKIVTKNLPIIINDFRKLYLQIINNEIETPFQDMPEIMVLEFFQAIINNAYSYEYFIKALNNSILEIGTNDQLTEEEKIYSLFFISVIYRALDIENPFDNLIDTFKGQIPQPIQFGLYYESKRDSKPSKLLKRIERNLKAKLKKQHDFHVYAKKLHELPLKKSKIKKLN